MTQPPLVTALFSAFDRARRVADDAAKLAQQPLGNRLSLFPESDESVLGEKIGALEGALDFIIEHGDLDDHNMIQRRMRTPELNHDVKVLSLLNVSSSRLASVLVSVCPHDGDFDTALYAKKTKDIEEAICELAWAIARLLAELPDLAAHIDQRRKTSRNVNKLTSRWPKTNIFGFDVSGHPIK